MCFMYLYIYFIYLGGKEYVESKTVFIHSFLTVFAALLSTGCSNDSSSSGGGYITQMEKKKK